MKYLFDDVALETLLDVGVEAGEGELLVVGANFEDRRLAHAPVTLLRNVDDRQNCDPQRFLEGVVVAELEATHAECERAPMFLRRIRLAHLHLTLGLYVFGDSEFNIRKVLISHLHPGSSLNHWWLTSDFRK